MKIPKEIADKVKCYMEHDKIAKKNYSEVCKWLKDNTCADGVDIEDMFITDKPSGTKQDDESEYCQQWNGYCEDDYHGNYYHQIEESNEYVGYTYCC